MTDYKILELVNNEKKLLLKGTEEPQTYWIEVFDLTMMP